MTNTLDAEEGIVGAALLVALIATFVGALVVPGVFDDEGVLFGVAFLVVCAMHLALYALAGRGDPALLGAVLRLAPWTLLGAILILAAGFTDGARVWLWLAAITVTYVGAALSGSRGWQLNPAHFAERYGLVVIIALGEAFIATGIGATGIGIGLGEVVAAILGVLVAASLWLAYFDWFSIGGERLLRDIEGPDRVALARDLYAYAHFPLIVGIVLFAFAMKTIVGHVGDELDSVTAFALCGGCALYLLTFSAIRTRFERRFEPQPWPLRGCTRVPPPASNRNYRPGTRGAGAREHRLAGVTRIRARLVARGSRRIALDARIVLTTEATRNVGSAARRYPRRRLVAKRVRASGAILEPCPLSISRTRSTRQSEPSPHTSTSSSRSASFDGVLVALYWTRGTDVLAVRVDDAATGDGFELVVAEKERPLDVFYHPFAYARARGVELLGDQRHLAVAIDV